MQDRIGFARASRTRRQSRRQAVDLADGASASANFKDGVIEIDLRLEGCSAGELHQQVALIVMQLDQHCALKIAPLGAAPRRRRQQPEMPPVEVRSTVAQLVSA